MAVLQTVTTVTIQGVSYSIYGTLANANSYFYASINASGWNAASQTSKLQSLVTAARMLDRQKWQSARTVVGQALAFPRTGLTDRNGEAVLSTDVPLGITAGEYELSNQLLIDATVETDVSSGSNTSRQLTRDKVGDLETERETAYFRPTLTTSSRFPTVVHELVSPYLEAGSSLIPCLSGAQDSPFLSRDFTFDPFGQP